MTKTQSKTKSTLKGSRLWGMLLFAILLLIDLVTKIWAEEYFTSHPEKSQIVLIDGWLNLTLTYNRGIAYGLGENSPVWAKLAIIGGTALLMLVLTVVYMRLDKTHGWARTAIVFIVAGGVGNLIDRVYYQVWDINTLFGVRDMVDLSRFGFAVCNFADFFISGGAVALVLSLLFLDKDALFPVGKYKKMAKGLTQVEEVIEAELVAKEPKNNG